MVPQHRLAEEQDRFDNSTYSRSNIRCMHVVLKTSIDLTPWPLVPSKLMRYYNTYIYTYIYACMCAHKHVHLYDTINNRVEILGNLVLLWDVYGELFPGMMIRGLCPGRILYNLPDYRPTSALMLTRLRKAYTECFHKLYIVLLKYLHIQSLSIIIF